MNTKNNNNKISFSFSRAEKYKSENDQLHEQIQKAEFEVNDLLQINQVRLFDIDMLECFFKNLIRSCETNFKLYKVKLINYKSIIIE
jgi:hypothetical protein